jgi:uncharacterized protein YrrD
MDIPLGVAVRCTDGEGGESAAVVLNPVTQMVSHLVVKSKGHVHAEYLVPLSLVGSSTVKDIALTCSYDEPSKLPPFMTKVRVQESGLDKMDAQALVGAETHSGLGFQDFSTAGSGATELVEQEAIPETELALRARTPVYATDDEVGHVDRLFVNVQTGELMQLVLQEKHLFSKKDYVVSLDQIDRIGEEAVHLKLSKHEVEQLPRV